MIVLAFKRDIAVIDERLESLGSNIRSIRKAKDISQEDLANLANIERGYMGYIERGQQNVSVEILWRIADALKVSISELFEGL